MNKKYFFVFFLLALFSFSHHKIFAATENSPDKVQFLLWAEKDAYPGKFYEGSVERIKKTSVFLLEGAVYGWNFEYVPYDKTRNVQEIFDFSPVRAFSKNEKDSIQYNNAAEKDSRLYCRVEFLRNQPQMEIFNSYRSLSNPKIRGKGNAPLELGFEGIQEACACAMKNAVREFWRSKIKNKPAEISGRLFLCAPPIIGVDSGQYTVTLDFFMETNKIIDYRMF